MKLVKVQREILTNAADSFAKHGVEKPIHVMSVNSKNDIDNFPKSYATYCKKMELLIEAGFISREINNDGYAYMTQKGYEFTATI